jgi:hypothetical protein
MNGHFKILFQRQIDGLKKILKRSENGFHVWKVKCEGIDKCTIKPKKGQIHGELDPF